MTLLDYWIQDQAQIRGKTVQQLISFAGDGRLRDDNSTSREFRVFLTKIPPEMLQQYAHECLDQRFDGSGYALQDIVNEIGARLDFDTNGGRYQGRHGVVGYDGLWRWKDGHTIVVEVKTTDAYRISIDTVASYRKALINAGQTTEAKSSILIVVGRDDTGDLEAQIRGSRHAWDMRLISVESLVRLMVLRQDVQDPQIIQRMYEILVPREFTKLDEIVEIVFSTAEDMKPEQIDEGDTELGQEGGSTVPVAYHGDCVARVQTVLSKSFVPRTKVLYSTANKDTALVCLVSREYSAGTRKGYWFGFHQYQKDFLTTASKGYVVLGCGSKDRVLLIDFEVFGRWLEGMSTTQRPNRSYWHVRIDTDGDALLLRLRNQKKVVLSSYLI